MQKIITICLLVLLCESLQAQFKKGDKVIGFDLNFLSTKYDINSSSLPQVNKNKSFTLTAELGFATKANRINGFFIGAGFGNSTQDFSTQPSSNSKFTFNSYSGGYFHKIYKPLGKNFFVFGEGRGGVRYAQQENINNASTTKASELVANIGIYPGVSYKWNQHFMLELRFADLLNTTFTRREIKQANNQTDVQKNFNLGTSLGIGYLDNLSIGLKWIL